MRGGNAVPKNKGWKVRTNQFKKQNKAEYDNDLARSIVAWRQMCIDAAFMAAADKFHMGTTRCEAFGQAMVDYLNEIVNTMHDDTDDAQYAKAKIDERLHQICGDKFQPWEERYGGSEI